MRKSAFVAVSVVGLALAGCSQTGAPGEKAVVGTAVGTFTGAAIGSAISGGGIGGTLIGAAVGAAAGAAIGAAMDEEDQRQMALLTEESFEDGEFREYVSPRTGARAKIRVSKARRVAQKTCKTATREITLRDGTTNKETVNACKGPNGWVV